jgi:AhpD family alkylhydroperoxidase
MSDLLKTFREYREKMNQKLMDTDNKVIKRIMNLDTNTYQEGALDSRTKEMLGLVASMVLRCDDCVSYHLEQCHQLNLSNEEMYEVFSIANLVGGTIVIPHTRRALEYWEALNKEKNGA